MKNTEKLTEEIYSRLNDYNWHKDSLGYTIKMAGKLKARIKRFVKNGLSEDKIIEYLEN